jgi:hypothetical protein
MFKNYDPTVKLTMFDQVPYLLPEDDIIVMSKNTIYNDKIKFLYFSLAIASSDLIKFNLYKTNEDQEDLIFIKKEDFKGTPVLIEKEKVNIDNNLILLFKEQIYNFDAKKNLPVVFTDDKTKSPKEEIQNNYDFISSAINLKNSNVKIYILEFFHKDSKFDGYEFVSIFINNKLMYLQNSSINFIFTIDNNPYIYLKQWLPSSGFICGSLFKVINKSLERVTIDCPYAN